MLQFSIMLILASNSPRRKEMLNWLGVQYTANPAHIDETPGKGESPLEYVQRMSSTKAMAVSREGDVILGADTIVVYEDEILGKPLDPQDAYRMLECLRDQSHKVHTALSLYQNEHNVCLKEICTSVVTMRDYTEQELAEYVKSGDPMDKAGAYAIQHLHFHPVVDFHGCMANVMGLPLCHLSRNLKALGIEIDTDVPAICKSQLRFDCIISKRILSGENIG